MKARQVLAGMLMTLPLAAAPDPRKQDLLLEQRISEAQSACVEAGATYQDWMNGRISSANATTKVQGFLINATTSQQAAVKLAAPGSQSSVRHWAKMQQRELGYFFSHIKTRSSQPLSQAQLQQSWQNAVDIQADLLDLRDRQLAVVQKAAGSSPDLKAYYQWKTAMQKVLRAELQLAQDVAQAFQQHNQAAGLTQKAIQLHGQAAAIKPPASCVNAHQLYLERFRKLLDLCGSAKKAINGPDADTVANLKEDEEAYRQKALDSDRESLGTLSSLLAKKR